MGIGKGWIWHRHSIGLTCIREGLMCHEHEGCGHWTQLDMELAWEWNGHRHSMWRE